MSTANSKLAVSWANSLLVVNIAKLQVAELNEEERFGRRHEGRMVQDLADVGEIHLSAADGRDGALRRPPTRAGSELFVDSD